MSEFVLVTLNDKKQYLDISFSINQVACWTWNDNELGKLKHYEHIPNYCVPT